MSKHLIGIMISSHSPVRSIKKYIRYNKTDSIIFSFTPQDINWDTNMIKGIYWGNKRWNLGEFPFPDAVYNRCFLNKSKALTKIGEIIGEDRTFNCTNRLDKWRIYKALEDTALSSLLPETWPYSKRNFMEIIDSYGYLFLKPCLGFKGKGIFRVVQGLDKRGKIYFNNSTSCLEFDNSYEFIGKISELVDSRPYIIQEDIPFLKIGSRSFDIRVLIQKNSEGIWEVSGALTRLSFEEYFITNVCYRICRPEEVLAMAQLDYKNILDKVYEASLDAAKALEKEFGHLGEISVDFGVDEQKKPWIIEANGKPDKALFKKLGDRTILRNIYSKPIEYACFLCQNK